MEKPKTAPRSNGGGDEMTSLLQYAFVVFGLVALFVLAPKGKPCVAESIAAALYRLLQAITILAWFVVTVSNFIEVYYASTKPVNRATRAPVASL